MESPLPVSSSLESSKIEPKPDSQQTFALQVEQLKAHMLGHTSSSCNMLQEVASYYIRKPSKAIRPILILLMAQATNGLGSEWVTKCEDGSSQGKVASKLMCIPDFGILTSIVDIVLNSQLRLAETVELLHVASVSIYMNSLRENLQLCSYCMMM